MIGIPKNRLKFHYIGDRKDPSKTGIITVATEISEDGQYIRLGFAFCSPKDQFSKKIGRIKAWGRMNSKEGYRLHFGQHSTDSIVAILSSPIRPNLPKIWKNKKFWATGDGHIEFV